MYVHLGYASECLTVNFLAWVFIHKNYECGTPHLVKKIIRFFLCCDMGCVNFFGKCNFVHFETHAGNKHTWPQLSWKKFEFKSAETRLQVVSETFSKSPLYARETMAMNCQECIKVLTNTLHECVWLYVFAWSTSLLILSPGLCILTVVITLKKRLNWCCNFWALTMTPALFWHLNSAFPFCCCRRLLAKLHKKSVLSFDTSLLFTSRAVHLPWFKFWCFSC